MSGYKPVQLPLLFSSTKMHRRGQPFSCLISQYAEDLDVDIETTNERKTKLGGQSKKPKADSKASAPVLSTSFNPIVNLPLHIIHDNSKVAKLRLKIVLHTFMFTA